jgi:hypothetical protein
LKGLLAPKSVSFTTPLRVTRALPPLTSRCTILQQHTEMTPEACRRQVFDTQVWLQLQLFVCVMPSTT